MEIDNTMYEFIKTVKFMEGVPEEYRLCRRCFERLYLGTFQKVDEENKEILSKRLLLSERRRRTFTLP